MTTALIRRGVHHVRVSWIEHDVSDAGVLADLEHRLPRLAAIRSLIQAAVAARRPQRTLRRDPHDVGVARVDRHTADLLGPLETDAPPRRAAVDALEHAVARRRAPEIRILARRQPH